MRTLVIAEHDGQQLRPATRAAIGFARQLAASGDNKSEPICLVLGHQVEPVTAQATQFCDVLVADAPWLEHPLANRLAPVIAEAARERAAQIIVAAASTFAKDVVSRAAGMLGGAMASDVVAHEVREGQLIFERPMYAGAILAKVILHGVPKVVTIRPTSYEAAAPRKAPGEVGTFVPSECSDTDSQWEGCAAKKTARPDVTEARVVVSGGRALKSADDFERLIGSLADALGGATGSSRALVDAGITPNEFQVGQTGKVVAPDIYFAVGISGAVQHLAGMKNSQVVVAINNDSDAPIFEVADYGIVGDVYEIVPRLIEAIKKNR